MRRVGAPGIDAVAPGRPLAEVQAALLALDLPLDEEVLSWFTAHDGQHVPSGAAGVHFFTPSLTLNTLDQAVSATRLARELEAESGLGVWNPRWLVLLPYGGQHLVVVECLPTSEEPGPQRVRSFFWGDAGGPGQPEGSVPTLGALVAAWQAAIDQGGWSVGTDGQWHVDRQRVPPPLKRALG